MKVDVLNKEFDLPEELVKLLHINNIAVDKEQNVTARLVYMVNSSNHISLLKYMNTLEWDLTVRQPAYLNHKKYGKSARENIKRLRKIGEEVKKYLEFVLGREMRSFSFPEVVIAIKNGDTELSEMSSALYFKKHIKEVDTNE